jgi:hypothetical protein
MMCHFSSSRCLVVKVCGRTKCVVQQMLATGWLQRVLVILSVAA